jgi:competence protein ComEA
MKAIQALALAVFLSLVSIAGFAAPVNINSADATTLADALVGVGPKGAAAIVEYRSKHGPFKSVEELSKVKGIGAKIVEKNRDRMTVGSSSK